jgi:hypothetical protein
MWNRVAVVIGRQNASSGFKFGKEELEQALIIMACVGGFRRVVEFAEMEERNEIEVRKHCGAKRVNIAKKDLVIFGDLGIANNQFNIGSMLAFRGGDCQDLVALWAHDVGAPEKVMFAAAKMENGFRADPALGKVLEEVKVTGTTFPIQRP